VELGLACKMVVVVNGCKMVVVVGGEGEVVQCPFVLENSRFDYMVRTNKLRASCKGGRFRSNLDALA
jgi:hypothetical protein